MSDNDEFGVDAELREVLVQLDPERDRPGYWARFHRSVVQRAALELARRRRATALTVSGMVTSWARTVVPSALMAAAVAGLILLRAPAEPTEVQPIGLEAVLAEGLEGQPIPAVLGDETFPDADGILFAAEIF